MQLIRGLNRWPDVAETAITIGNFDGAHLGHQAMFSALTTLSAEQGLISTVVSFEPLPHEYFLPQGAPPRLHGLRDRVASIREAGIERLLLLEFDHTFANQSPECFIDDVLIKQLHTQHLLIGDDFRFGYQRQGTFETLKAASARHEFSLQQSETCLLNGQRISSTRVREHLSRCELDKVAALLGRPYRISGRVIHGEKVGRQLGFPTANVALGSHRPALRGVFAVWATDLETGLRHAAVANLGERPTLGGRKLLLEVHLLDANLALYGHHLSIDFIAQLRAEKRFDSLEDLKTQIALDAHTARELIAHR